MHRSEPRRSRRRGFSGVQRIRLHTLDTTRAAGVLGERYPADLAPSGPCANGKIGACGVPFAPPHDLAALIAREEGPAEGGIAHERDRQAARQLRRARRAMSWGAATTGTGGGLYAQLNEAAA